MYTISLTPVGESLVWPRGNRVVRDHSIGSARRVRLPWGRLRHLQDAAAVRSGGSWPLLGGRSSGGREAAGRVPLVSGTAPQRFDDRADRGQPVPPGGRVVLPRLAGSGDSTYGWRRFDLEARVAAEQGKIP